MSERMPYNVADQTSHPVGRIAFKAGEPVIYRRTKIGPHPGPRAEDIRPSRAGEDYSYCVDKYWMVVTSLGEQLLVRTRRGKEHWVDADDPNLRRPHWWEKLIHRDRFPRMDG